MFSRIVNILSNIILIFFLFVDFQNSENFDLLPVIAIIQLLIVCFILIYNYLKYKRSNLSPQIKLFSAVSFGFIIYNYFNAITKSAGIVSASASIFELYKMLICFLFFLQIYLSDLKYEKYVLTALAAYIFMRGLYQKFIGFDYILELYGTSLPPEALGRIADGRIYSVFVLPNIFASYSIITAAALIESYKQNSNIFEKIFIAALIAVSGACAFYSKTLSAALSCLSALALIFLIKKNNKRIFLGTIFFLAICFIIIMSYRGMNNIYNKSIKYYFGNFEAALKIWKNENVLTGVGPGQFKNYYFKYKPDYANDVIYAHNYYLQTLAESGIIGFAILFVCIYLTVKIIFFELNCKTYLKFILIFFLINNFYGLDGVILSSSVYFSYFLGLAFKSKKREIMR